MQLRTCIEWMILILEINKGIPLSLCLSYTLVVSMMKKVLPWLHQSFHIASILSTFSIVVIRYNKFHEKKDITL